MEIEKYKDKSFERTKITFKNIIDSALRETCSTVPLGGIGYDWIKVLINHALKYREDQNQERIENFHHAIFQGVDASEKQQILECDFSMKDYIQILSYVVRDDENEKMDVYARIFKALQNNAIPQNYRNHFLRSSRELLTDDIEFMRKVFIVSKFKFKDDGDIDHQMRNLTITTDPIINLSIQNLVRTGFLYEKPATGPNKPTEMLNAFVNIIYTPNDLTPEAIGKKVWSDHNVTIVCKNLDKHSNLLYKISNSFFQENIKAIPVVPSHVHFTAQIIVLVHEETNLDDSMKKLIEKFKIRITTLNLFLPSAVEIFSNDENSFYLKSYGELDIKEFVRWVISKI